MEHLFLCGNVNKEYKSNNHHILSRIHQIQENLPLSPFFVTDEERQHILELAGSVLIQNASQTTLTKVERQLMSIAKYIIQGWIESKAN